MGPETRLALEELKADLAASQRRAALDARLWRVGMVAAAGFGLLLGAGAAPGDAQNGGGSQAGGLPALQTRVAALEAQNASQGQQIAALTARVAALEAKTQYLTVSGTETYFTGTNVHIRNGMGSTNGNPDEPLTLDPGETAVNGLGNLIIGYNALPPFPIDRSGSHYLVTGDLNAYTSFGGIAAGWANTVSAAYASTLGGRSNRSTGAFCSIVGGAFNHTDGGNTASILGGNANQASNIDSTVCGGNQNHASARFSVIGGGSGLLQGAEFGWCAGSFGAGVSGRFVSP